MNNEIIVTFKLSTDAISTAAQEGFDAYFAGGARGYRGEGNEAARAKGREAARLAMAELEVDEEMKRLAKKVALEIMEDVLRQELEKIIKQEARRLRQSGELFSNESE